MTVTGFDVVSHHLHARSSRTLSLLEKLRREAVNMRTSAKRTWLTLPRGVYLHLTLLFARDMLNNG